MGKIATGSIQMPSTYTKNSGSPLDDRDLVENKIDLITSSTWTVGSDDTRYEGMVVYVASESKLYCLIDISKKDTSDYSGWKDITDTAGVTSVGLSMPNIFNVSGSPITDSGTITASFTNQNDKTIFGRNSGSSGVPSFIDATNLWTIEGIGDNANTAGLLKKTAQNTWTLTSNYSDVGLYNKKLQHKLNSNTAIDVGNIIRETNLDLSLPEFYAPTTVGSQYAFLTSNGSGAPSWKLPTLASGKTTGLLKYTVGSGWTFDSNTYLTSEQYIGTVTEITAGNGLNTTSGDTSTDGGTITSTGTLYLTKTAVTPGTYQGITVDKYGRITSASDQGYTTNTGTVTSVQVQATSPVSSSTSTASSTTLNTTISLDNAYGDTKNPYGSKTANHILAAPNGSSGVPSFRTLVSDDIPNLTISKISDFPTLANVATTGSYNDLQDTPTIPTVNNSTITITQGGVTKGSFTLNQSNNDTIALDAGGGTGNDYTTTLNNTSYPSTPASGAISLGSWYAPTSGTTSTSGATAAGQLLLSVGSTSTPIWSSFTFPTLGTTKMLTYVGGSGWSLDNIIDTKNTVGAGPNTANSVLYLIGVAANSSTNDDFYTKSYCPTQHNYIGTDYYLYSRSGNTTNARVINTVSTGLAKTTNQENSIYLKTASTTEIGGIRVASTQSNAVIINTTDYGSSTSNRRYAVHICTNTNNNTNLAYVNVPWTEGSVPGVASVTGDNPGLLKVTADAEPRNVFINDKYVDAIPVFYGQVNQTSVWNYVDDEEEYSEASYVEEKDQFYEGHYVNIADIINGLVRNPILLTLLRDKLKKIWDSE